MPTTLRNLWSLLTPATRQQCLWNFPVRPRGIGSFLPESPLRYNMEPVVILHGEESYLTSQITRRHLDRVVRSSTELPHNYPKKLFLKILPKGRSGAPPCRTWDLAVLGPKEQLSFTLQFPLLPSMSNVSADALTDIFVCCTTCTSMYYARNSFLPPKPHSSSHRPPLCLLLSASHKVSACH